MKNDPTTINAEEMRRGQNFIYFGQQYKATDVRVLSESVTIDVEGSNFGIQFTLDDKLKIVS